MSAILSVFVLGLEIYKSLQKLGPKLKKYKGVAPRNSYDQNQVDCS